MAAAVIGAPMVRLIGAYTQLAVPAVLYHGTCSQVADAILAEGLLYQKGSQQSMASRGGNYLATSLAMAASFAKSRAFRTGGTPVVFAVQAHKLIADALSFDLNMCGRYWSEALVYQDALPPNLLTLVEKDIKALPDARMLLNEPTPGVDQVAIDLNWEKARLFC